MEGNKKAEAVRAIAFYLPQFHPIPENDCWWGPGFTEWTNVAKARPLFWGHRQPILPGALGFYDLRVEEVREQQAVLAKKAGIESFCYWHYWFAGKRLLERPFEEVLATGHPDMGFCLGWANETWSGIWHGEPGRVLVEQTYPGADDHRRHFDYLLPAFLDKRYTRVDDKPLFYIFKPQSLPEAARTIEHWRGLAEKAGLAGLFMIAETHDPVRVLADGFDGYVRIPSWREVALGRRFRKTKLVHYRLRGPLIGRHSDLVRELKILEADGDPRRFPCIVPGWDNTPRSRRRGVVLRGRSPGSFQEQARVAVQSLLGRCGKERLLFVKSWNEWAEGNHMEPDSEWGELFIEALGSVLGETGYTRTGRK